MCVYIYIYIYIERERDTHVCVYVYVYVYIYIYIEREILSSYCFDPPKLFALTPRELNFRSFLVAE